MTDKSTCSTCSEFYIPDAADNPDAAANLAYSAVQSAAEDGWSSDMAISSLPGCSTVDPASFRLADTSTNAAKSSLPVVSSSPRLDIRCDGTQPRFRARCYSAPSILYHQVALQLRSISDDFNREYSIQQDVEQVPRRRASLPATTESVSHQQQQRQDNRQQCQQLKRAAIVAPLPRTAEHVHRPANWLHNVLESFRAASHPRPHRSSISRVPEELEDMEDIDIQPPEPVDVHAATQPLEYEGLDITSRLMESREINVANLPQGPMTVDVATNQTLELANMDVTIRRAGLGDIDVVNHPLEPMDMDVTS